MIAAPSISSPSRPTHSIPNVSRLRNTRAWQSYEEGQRYLQRPEKAKKYFHKAVVLAIEISKKDAAILADYIGVELSKAGLHLEALSYFDKALEIDSNYAKIWNNKGISLDDLGKCVEAITCYDKALEINPIFAQAWNNKGVSLRKLGKHDEAITCYDKALEIDLRYAMAWNNKGAALADLGRYEEAIVCYAKALEIDPLFTMAWDNKGITLGRLGKDEEAIRCFEKALEIDPKYAMAWNNKCVALSSMGRHEEAVECVRKVLELNKDYPEPHINLAFHLSVANCYEEAEREFKEALRLFKKKQPERLEEALGNLEKGLDAHRDNHSLWRAKGEFLKALGRETEAKKSLERAEFYEAIRYFEANKEGLLRQYEGKFVAILHDEVVDSDEDFEALGERIIKKFGSRDILVRRVTKEPEVIYIPTPFLVH